MLKYITRLHFDRFDALLAALCLYHFVSNTVWILLSTAPLPWDQAGHTRLALLFLDYFKNLGFLKIANFFSISTYYPPLIHTIVAFFIFIFGHPIITTGIVITLFFVTSIVLLFIYSLDLFKKKSVAFLASFVFSFFPIVFEHSRSFLLEIPLLAFFITTLIFLYRSKSFTNRFYTYAFFIALSFCALTKWTFFLYLIFPIAFEIYRWIKLENEKRLQTLESLSTGLTIFFLVTFSWYLINIPNVLRDLPVTIQPEVSDPKGIFTPANIIHYIYLFINFQITFYMAILFIFACLYIFFSRKPHRVMFFGSIFVIYLIFTLIPNKDWRYTMPLLPFVAIIVSLFLVKIWNFSKKIGKVIVLATILYLIFYHIELSFRFPLNLTFQRAIKLPILGWIDYININDNLVHAYNASSWPQEQLLQKISKDSKGKEIKVLVLVDQERLNAGNIFLARDLLEFKNIDIKSPPLDPFSGKEYIENFLSDFEYAVIARQDVGVEATRNLKVFYQLKKAIEEGINIMMLESHELPNKDRVTLYRLHKQI